MSMYCTVLTQFKSPSALVAALAEAGGWTTDQIEIHETPQNLFGYKGDIRTQKAHVIVRRQHVGSASNDIGFELDASGQYVSHVSRFDSKKYGEDWMKRLRQAYAFHAIRIQQENKGRHVTRKRLENGKTLVEVTGYR